MTDVTESPGVAEDPAPIEWDVDVLFGPWPSRGIAGELGRVRAIHARAAIRGGLALSARGALFDAVRGNDETLERLAAVPDLEPVGTVDLRDALAGEAELERLSEAGVGLLRLFPSEQGCEPGFPAFRHLAGKAAQMGFTLLCGGDVRRFGPALRGMGARVIFLDVHAYHVADFVLLAREEEGFVASTRLLNAPDSIERVAAEVGAGRLAFGSRVPLQEVSPAAWRLRTARLSDEERAVVAGGTVARLLGEVPT